MNDYLIIYKYRVKNWWLRNEKKLQNVIETIVLTGIAIEVVILITLMN